MIFYYIYYEHPKQEKSESMINFTISISNEQTPDQFLAMDYEIIGKDISYSSSGRTSKYGAILHQVPFNRSFALSVYTIGDYYSSSKEFSSDKPNQHLRILLRKASQIELESNTNMHLNDTLKLNVKLKDKGYYDNILFCIKWGIHIIKIDNLNNFTEINKINENYDKCYSSGISLNESFNNFDILLNYKKVGTFDENDFINVLVMDSNLINGEYIIKDSKDLDIGGENKEFIFKN